MIDFNAYDLFRYRDSLDKISKDTADTQNIQYMTQSKKRAIDFDKVKEEYERSIGLKDIRETSVDALTSTQNLISFIEFKNGKMKNEQQCVKDKIRDSLLIFCDITQKNISYTRDKAEFTLVYNEDKNPMKPRNGCIQSSKSRTDIAKKITQLGQKEIIQFGLEKFQGLYFKSVHTYTEKEFESYEKNLRSDL